MGEVPSIRNGSPHPGLINATVRFGSFEVDLRAGELRKGGVKIKLPDQPFQVLVLLLERPGQVVTREELKQKLWAGDTFVDFEHGLNKAISRAREALADDADNPRFIETLPRRGYRFITGVNGVEQTVEDVGAVRAAARRKRLSWLIGMTIAVLLAVGFVSYRLWPRPPRSPKTLNVVPFTSYPGFEVAPSFSPDGNAIVFAWNGGADAPIDALDLYVKQLGSETPLRLTHHPAPYLAPAWSPDGRFIAFSRVNRDGSSGIFEVSPLGSPERLLTKTQNGMPWQTLSWSPDSKLLALLEVDKQGQHVHLLDAETLEKRVLPPPAPGCIAWGPAFSPDGKSLALMCLFGYAPARIYVQSVRDETAREIARFNGDWDSLVWSADGRYLLYNFKNRLWRVPASGGTPEEIPFLRDVHTLAVARSGSRLAYSQQTPSVNTWRLDLKTAETPLKAPFKLLAFSRDQEAPSISPDGRRIAFRSDRSGSPEIWVCDSDCSNPVQLTFFEGPRSTGPRWSPNSRQLVFTSGVSGAAQIYIVNDDGGPPRRLRTIASNPESPSWSADGHWIYFVDAQFAAETIWKVGTAGQAALKLANKADLPQESADGSRILFSREGTDDTALWSASLEGGDERTVGGMPPISGAWLSTRNGIYFVENSAIPPTLNLFDPSSHDIHRIAQLRGRTEPWQSGLSITADGHTLVYADSDPTEADIMLVEGVQ